MLKIEKVDWSYLFKGKCPECKKEVEIKSGKLLHIVIERNEKNGNYKVLNTYICIDCLMKKIDEVK